ncbi:hypothetical protein PUN28_003410 [Cardiocondyla obscurior]|uniref:Uncharacterized protein n=1 Tax=Cardiocondyla obscurior TaxID=286306 RepID=A0AAW2GJK3_9HYME
MRSRGRLRKLWDVTRRRRWAVEGACHSDCSNHTRTLEPHTYNSWPHATCLDTPGYLRSPGAEEIECEIIPRENLWFRISLSLSLSLSLSRHTSRN